ncbi:hypothetical protein D9M69_594400 [compost metagenome]
MAHQCHAHLHPRALHQTHQPGRQTLRLQHVLDQAEHALRQLRVARMRLHHDRATSGQGRGGVATQDRESERKVAGREHGHRTQRHALKHHGRVAHGRCAGHGRVVQALEGHTPRGDVGEAAQLKRGAVELAVEARSAQRCLHIGQRHQRFAIGFQRSGERVQELGALRAGAAAPGAECGGGGLGGGVDVGGR